MKKIILFLFLSCLTSSCFKDRKIKKTLIGEWKCKKSGFTEKVGKESGSSTESSVRPSARTGGDAPLHVGAFEISVEGEGTCLFNKDNTGKMDMQLIRTILHSGALIVKDTNLINSSFTWKVDDENLIIEHSDGTVEQYAVLSFSSSSVECEMLRGNCYNYSFIDPVDGTSVSYSICFKLSFSR